MDNKYESVEKKEDGHVSKQLFTPVCYYDKYGANNICIDYLMFGMRYGFHESMTNDSCDFTYWRGMSEFMISYQSQVNKTISHK